MNPFNLSLRPTCAVNTFRRHFLSASMAAATSVLAVGVHAADVFPTKPIRIVVPVAAGSASDLVARELASRLTKHLGQSVVVDNRPGADMAIGVVAAARSPADGHTWVLVGSTLTSSAVLKKVPFDPVKDFAPVSILGYATTVAVVPPDLGVRSLKDFIALAKANPGTVNYANPAAGSLGHLNAALLEHSAGIRMTSVPYKGSSPAVLDLLAGRVQFMMAPPGVAAPHVSAGKLLALGVVGPERLNLYPDLPTMKELGIQGVDLEAWMGVLMPAGTPQAIVTRANAAISAALRGSGAREALEKAGLRAVAGGTPDAFAQQIRDDLQQWPRIFDLAKVPRQD